MEKDKFREITQFENVKDLLYHSVQQYADHIAFTIKIKNEKKEKQYKYITYQEFLEQVNSLGTALYSLGLEDKKVAVIGKNSYEWALAHVTNLLGGMISVPLDKGLQLEELENSLIRSEAEAIIFDLKQEELIKKIQESGKTKIQFYICMNELEEFENLQNLIQKGKNLQEKGRKEFIEKKIDSEKMSILLFTSGTTSQSKAVMLSQKGIAMNIGDMLMVEKFYDTDVNIAFLPFHHVFGSTGLLVMLACGIRTVFPDGLKYVKQNLQEYGVSVFIGVPLLIDKIYQNIEKEIAKQGKTKIVAMGIQLTQFLLKFHIDLRRIVFKQVIDQLGGKMRFIISGGAPLDKEVAKKFRQLGMKMVQGYGLTETSPVIAAENDYFIKEGSVGIPMKHVEVEIVNQDNEGIGEIRVKGSNVMLGYYKNEEKTKEVLKDNWFYTGDLGYLDEEGFLFITGRSKDMIVLKNGKKVFPEELEILINQLEEVEESFVYGMPSKDDPNHVKLSVKVVYDQEVVKEKYPNKNELGLQEIIWKKIKEINQTLPQYKYIKGLIITQKPLIKTTTNKTKRQEEMKRILGENN